MDLISRLFTRSPVVDRRTAYEAALERENFTAAVPFLHAAAGEGDARAMMMLGSALMLGWGIDQDLIEGLAWIRQAATRGEPRGMLTLAAALADGTGCTQDDGEAAFWYYKAGVAGLHEATDGLGALLLRKPSLMGLHFTPIQFLTLRRRAYHLSQA